MNQPGPKLFCPKAEEHRLGCLELFFRRRCGTVPYRPVRKSAASAGGRRFRGRRRLDRLRRALATPQKALAGFTIIELLVTITVVGILAGVGVASYLRSIEQAKITSAVADIAVLENEIITFFLINDRFPDNLIEIGRDTMLDPYGNPYAYLNIQTAKGKGEMRKDHFLVPLNTDFDLYSMGKDGESVSPLTAKKSHDDIIRANNGEYIGLASSY